MTDTISDIGAGMVTGEIPVQVRRRPHETPAPVFDPAVDYKAWWDHAACKGRTDLFFPALGNMRGLAAAKRICRRCPVIDQCRAYSLRLPPRTLGVFAGLSARERNQLRKEQK